MGARELKPEVGHTQRSSASAIPGLHVVVAVSQKNTLINSPGRREVNMAIPWLIWPVMWWRKPTLVDKAGLFQVVVNRRYEVPPVTGG